MTTLAQYERARAALAEATKVDQVLGIHDEVEHIKLYAQQIRDQALLADASEFQMRVERRLGALLKAAKEAGQIDKGGRPRKGPETGRSERAVLIRLADVGVSKDLSARAQKRASLADDAFEQSVTDVRERIVAGRAKIIEAPLPLPRGNRALMAGRQEPDDSRDFFPTPPFATRALTEHVLPQVGHHKDDLRNQSFWEPACGAGHMAEVLHESFGSGRASDIHDYGYGDTIDFLADGLGSQDGDCGAADWIITNPPFNDKTEAFVLRALDLATVGVAMFVRLQWLETIGRYERLFLDRPPTLIAIFPERVNLCKGRWEPDGATATAYIWLVWRKGVAPQAPFWIPPGCRKQLTKVDDERRFTAHPVIKAQLKLNQPPVTDDVAADRQGDKTSAKPIEVAKASGVAAAAAVIPSDMPDIPGFLKRGNPACAVPPKQEATKQISRGSVRVRDDGGSAHVGNN